MALTQINCHKCKRALSIDTSMFQDNIRKKVDCPFCGVVVFVKLVLIYGTSPESIHKYEQGVANYINHIAYGYSLEPKVKEYLDNLIKGDDDGQESEI